MKIFIKKIFLALCVFFIVVVLGGLHAFLLKDRKKEAGKFAEISGHQFSIEIAEDPVAQARGLSGRDQLENNEGMLFIFPEETTRTFWMAGMKFSLDIIWIRNNVVVGITKNLPPATAENMQLSYSPGAVDMVLEINSGLSDQLGIRVGDSVTVSK